MSTNHRFMLMSLIPHEPGANISQRYQQIVVAAIDAAHEGGLPVPGDYLARLVEATADGIAPKLRFVLLALADTMRRRGVDDPWAAAAEMLPAFSDAED